MIGRSPVLSTMFRNRFQKKWGRILNFLIFLLVTIHCVLKVLYCTGTYNHNRKPVIMNYYIKLARTALKILAKEGPASLARKGRKYYRLKNQYDIWQKLHENDLMSTKPLNYTPLISVVAPVYNVKREFLVSCIESVRSQTYENWELVLVDDCSTMDEVRSTLLEYEGKERIKIIYREKNGHISACTNTGIENTTGEFVGLLDCDDTLAPNALYEVAKLLNDNKELDFIYSDEDLMTENGKKRMNAFFKPDWSPDTFMSLMYTCHFSVYRRSLLKELGGLRVGYEGSQDYDLVLRVMEKTKKIGHIPKILYHWRARKESTANALSAKPYIKETTVHAKKDALKRRGLTGHLEWEELTRQYRVVYEPHNNPKVSVVIPSKDNYNVLLQCIKSLYDITEYKNFEVLVIDNGSTEENRQRIKKMLSSYGARYEYRPMEFNFSSMCNIGASLTDGELILFLNDDIEIRGGEWLLRLAGHAALPHAGAVGCKLYYPGEKEIQHCGVLNLPIGPGHAFHHFTDKGMVLYYGRNLLEYNFSAVTGACLMVERKKFDEVGGFDESLAVAYNDVELCFKLIEAGYFNVLRNDVVMIHHESVSRGYEDVSKEKLARQKREMKRLYELHPNWKGKDPFYNINLTRDKGDFSFDIPL